MTVMSFCVWSCLYKYWLFLTPSLMNCHLSVSCVNSLCNFFFIFFRNLFNRLLGKFEEASHDLCESLKIDYDDQTNEWLSEVKPNAEKLRQHKLSTQRKKEEREVISKTIFFLLTEFHYTRDNITFFSMPINLLKYISIF